MRTADSIAIDNLTPAQVLQLQNQGRILLIDVREPLEYQQVRIPGAALRPLSCFDVASLPRDPARQLVFQCGSGKRSRSAAEAFARAGNGRAAHLAGGLAAWREAGYTTVCGE